MALTNQTSVLDLEFVDLSPLFAGTDFLPFQTALQAGGQVKAICVPGCAGYSRKQLDDLTAVARVFGASTLAYVKVAENEVQSPLLKNLGEAKCREMAESAQAKPGDLLLIISGSQKVVAESLGAVRLQMGKQEKLIDSKALSFLWVTDFPMFDYDPTEKRYVACHHPFTSPTDEDLDKIASNPAAVRAKAYDLVSERHGDWRRVGENSSSGCAGVGLQNAGAQRRRSKVALWVFPRSVGIWDTSSWRHRAGVGSHHDAVGG